MREETICKICFNLLNDIDYHLKEAQEKTDDITNKFLDKEKDPLSYKPHQLIALSSASPHPPPTTANISSGRDSSPSSLTRRRNVKHRNKHQEDNDLEEEDIGQTEDDLRQENARFDGETELVIDGGHSKVNRGFAHKRYWNETLNKIKRSHKLLFCKSKHYKLKYFQYIF